MTTRENVTELAELASQLRAAIAGLDAHVDRRAAELADPKIAAAEHRAADRIAQLEQAHQAELANLNGVTGELRRILDLREEQYGRLAYAARHLPEEVRLAAGLPAGGRVPPGRVAEEARQRIDQAAIRAGLGLPADHRPPPDVSAYDDLLKRR